MYACKLKMQALNVQTKEDQAYDEAQLKVDEHLQGLTQLLLEADLEVKESVSTDIGRISEFKKKSKVLIAQ